MNASNIRHFALIPAKKRSSRCKNKNWRLFNDGSLVDFTIRCIPQGVFHKIILSTDKLNYRTPAAVEEHLRPKSLSTKGSCIKDLIRVILQEYPIGDDDYLWLLNPTSPFRAKNDYLLKKWRLRGLR